jgi:hypothetical protein
LPYKHQYFVIEKVEEFMQAYEADPLGTKEMDFDPASGCCSLSPDNESVAHLYLSCTNQRGHISTLNQRWPEFHGWGLFIWEPYVYFNAWHNLDVFMKYRSLAVFCEARQTE